MADISKQLQQRIEAACHGNIAINIIGGDSKSWYGREAVGQALHVGNHSGIVNYQPTELIMTARAGTLLSEITDALDEQRQRLPFDPPHYGEAATLGGTVACGFSGPRRPYAGACRDFILGCRIINGKGEILRFGGEVMKNVAGFDVSRLMAGSLGTLGLLLDVSMKVLPHRQAEQTVVIEAGFIEALRIMHCHAATPLPVTAMAADGTHVYFRICATPSSVLNSAVNIGGAVYEDGLQLWKNIREHQLPFFADNRPLWRLSVPSNAAHPMLADAPDDDWFIGWGGAQRWLKTDMSAARVFEAAQSAGGHATLFRSHEKPDAVFAPMPTALMHLHQRLKTAFDPQGILNPGRMYAAL